jgi:hypothetical protein
MFGEFVSPRACLPPSVDLITYYTIEQDLHSLSKKEATTVRVV